MSFLKKHETIERYLAGQLDHLEKAVFEQELQNNPMLADEVEQLRQLQENLHFYANRVRLKEQFDNFHKEIEEKQKTAIIRHPLIQAIWKKRIPTLAVAASITLIVSLGVWWNMRNVNNLETKQITYYQSLKKDIDDVKEKQKSLEAIAAAKNEQAYEAPVDHTATAFVISANGYLVTNYHAVKGASKMYIEAKLDSVQKYLVETIYTDERRDLAILKINDTSFNNFKALPYSIRYDIADLGEDVFTLAYPREDLVYGEGTISSRTGYEGDTLEYQVSIPVNPGNSGGPLMDEKGNLIGIVHRKHTKQEGAAFAIKAEAIKQVVELISNTIDLKEEPIKLPQYNSIAYLKRPQQIKYLQNYIFELKVFGRFKEEK